MLSETLNRYREALRLWAPLLTVHLLVRLVSTAVLVPLIGGLLAIAISFSNQPALTDQDIARFLLTPAGAIGGFVICSLIIVTAVIDVAAMTVVLRGTHRTPLGSLRAAVGFLIQGMPRLVEFAGALLVRLLAIALPILAVAGLGVFALLGEFDINYYLTDQPPEFLIAVALGGASLLVLALVLAERLTGWAIALHLSLFDDERPKKAFALSRNIMRGHRLELACRILIWLVIRLVLASAVAAAVGFMFAEVPQYFGDSLRMLFAVTVVLLGILTIANSVVSAIANGALSDILNEEFDRSLEARPAKSDTKADHRAPGLVTAIVVVVVLAVASLGLGSTLLSQVGGVEDIEVIGHRGAAASRPENTMAAIIKAIEDGADWVEIDVQETADGEVLVAHDSDFMKAAGVNLTVWDATMDDIAGVDIGSWFDPVYADERAPLLRDVLLATKDRSKVIIELKYYGHDIDLENRVIAIVEEAGMQDQIATMSLKYPAVQKMLRRRPGWRTGVLAATGIGDLARLDGDFLAVSMGSVTGRLIAQARAQEKDVYAWTVNDPVMMSRMISMGVGGLITDEPQLAREVMEFRKQLSTPERILLWLGDTIGMTFDIDPDLGNEV